MAFVGDGNNVAASLALACASAGRQLHDSRAGRLPRARLRVGGGPDAGFDQGNAGGVGRGPPPGRPGRRTSSIPTYGSAWGDEAESAERLRAFEGFQVNAGLFAQARPDAVFMHDMPAHRGEEVSEGMIEHPRSVVFDQAENRLHAQKAVLARLFTGD